MNRWEDILYRVPFGLFLVDAKGMIRYANQISFNFFDKKCHQIIDKPIQSVLPSIAFPFKEMKKNKLNTAILTNEKGQALFVLKIPLNQRDGNQIELIIFCYYKDVERFIDNSKTVKDVNKELELIMNVMGELVTITDGEGKIVRVNAACEDVMGVSEQEFVGKSVQILEKHGVMDNSCTRLTLENGVTNTIIQTTKSGRRLVVHAHPILNEKGDIVKVINISKDITEEKILREKLEETKFLLKTYQSALIYSNKKIEEKIIIKSKVMQEVFDLAKNVADVEATVLILGESGVGKEVVARTIHNLSSRKEHPFLKVNCGAIPKNLMESELFGYSKGSFTGADKAGKQGLILSANKGTLLLDEIGELSLDLQVKLLQVLQDKQITPIGRTTPIDVDVRFIAATNRDLEAMVKENLFREDLYYRLNVIPFNIPPLRERKEDIPFLIEHFLNIYTRKYSREKIINKEVIQIFVNYGWPGNIRELQNSIERLVVTASQKIITPTLLEEYFTNETLGTGKEMSETLPEIVEKYERNIIEKTLKESRTMKEASKKLGVNISTISRKVRKYKIKFADLQ